jgi:hypothetical protein
VRVLTCAKHLRSEHAGWCRKCDDAFYGGFPFVQWRSRVARTKRFIESTRRTGNVLEPPPEINADFALELAKLDRKGSALISDRAQEHSVGDPAAERPPESGS